MVRLSGFCDDAYAFFFSSRRRHTRWPRDWSSDVCSSDLVALNPLVSLDDFDNGDRTDSDPALREPIQSRVGDNRAVHRPTKFRKDVGIDKRPGHGSLIVGFGYPCALTVSHDPSQHPRL